MLSDTKLRELTRVSKAAFGLPLNQGMGWSTLNSKTMVWDASGDAIVSWMSERGNPYFEPPIASYIAAAQPETVLEMARELLALRAQTRTLIEDTIEKCRLVVVANAEMVRRNNSYRGKVTHVGQFAADCLELASCAVNDLKREIGAPPEKRDTHEGP